jgi:hypothetical protein
MCGRPRPGGGHCCGQVGSLHLASDTPDIGVFIVGVIGVDVTLRRVARVARIRRRTGTCRNLHPAQGGDPTPANHQDRHGGVGHHGVAHRAQYGAGNATVARPLARVLHSSRDLTRAHLGDTHVHCTDKYSKAVQVELRSVRLYALAARPLR